MYQLGGIYILFRGYMVIVDLKIKYLRLIITIKGVYIDFKKVYIITK